ncbi:MAG: hypothetical protein IVW36_10350 [Dehalococcoidia bacterium]|nr:hypothetical protein [Dehalococcoidia bacterium]
MDRRLPVAALALCLLATLVLAGCGGGGKAANATSTASSTTPFASTASPAAPTADAGRIRAVDLAQAAPVQTLVAGTGGAFVASQVIYGDLTGDGIDEAVVPLASGGTMGNIAYVVLTPSGSGVSALPLPKGDASSGGVAVSVVGGKLVDTRPQYGPNDPNCCPSMLRKTTYGWDGGKFVVASTETVTNPDAGAKGTPAAASTGTSPAPP